MIKIRKVIFWTHLAAGVIVGAVILFMSVTGMMLAFRPQIVGVNPQAKVFMKKIEGWHRWFGMEGNLKPIAHDIKSICTSIFLVMIISGFYLWWPRKKIKFEPGTRGRAQNWNLHNVIGFWAAPFLMTITITGLLMSYLPRHDRPREHKTDIVKEEQIKDTPERKFRKLIRSIHTGEAGGIVGEVIAFLVAGCAVMLVWTGFSMALQRFYSWRSLKLKGGS